MDSAQQSFEIADPVVKEVANAGRSAAQEFEGVPVADFSDNHHADVRVLRAQLLGGAKCRLGVNAGGADAHDEHVGRYWRTAARVSGWLSTRATISMPRTPLSRQPKPSRVRKLSLAITIRSTAEGSDMVGLPIGQHDSRRAPGN